METCFAPAERAAAEDLKLEISSVSQNPVINGLLGVVGGLLAVLNEHRQILALNETLLESLDVENVNDVLGLRPGEALHCVHAHEMPGGCGTSRLCSTCGAAIAIVTSLSQNKSAERVCAMTVNKDGREVDLCFSVRSYPIHFGEQRLLLLFLQDISKQQQWANMERVFFHDIRNIMTGLMGNSELLLPRTEGLAHELAVSVNQLAVRLCREVEIQQCLTRMDTHAYEMVQEKTSVRKILEELQAMFHHHSAAKGKILNFDDAPSKEWFRTDVSLVIRIVGNMITNALEASSPGDEVRVWIEEREQTLGFYVWNSQFIPDNVAGRIFQRSYSTKGRLGRGLGTYSMKLLGETLLKGKVSFQTFEREGTTFRFELPVKRAAK